MISTKFKDWGRHSISAFENRKEEPGRFFLDFSISVENEIFHSSSYEENIPRNLPSKEIIEGILNGKGRETYEEKWGYIGLLCNTPGVLMMKQYFIGKMGENTQLSMETNNLHQEVSTHIDLIVSFILYIYIYICSFSMNPIYYIYRGERRNYSIEQKWR